MIFDFDNLKPIEQLVMLIIIPFLIFIIISFKEKIEIWSDNKNYDRLLTLLTAIISSLIFVYINNSINLILFISIIVISILILIYKFQNSSFKSYGYKKIFIVIAYSVLVSTFFYINFPNDSSKETIKVLEEINREFVSHDSSKLNSLITKKINDIEKQRDNNIEYEKIVAFCVLILSIFVIIILEDKNREDFPLN